MNIQIEQMIEALIQGIIFFAPLAIALLILNKIDDEERLRLESARKEALKMVGEL